MRLNSKTYVFNRCSNRMVENGNKAVDPSQLLIFAVFWENLNKFYIQIIEPYMLL